MAGTIHGLASWIVLPECKNLVWPTHPPGQPPSRSSDTSGLSVVLRWGRFLALRNHDGKGVQRTNEGSPAGWRWNERGRANGDGLQFTRQSVRSFSTDPARHDIRLLGSVAKIARIKNAKPRPSATTATFKTFMQAAPLGFSAICVAVRRGGG